MGLSAFRVSAGNIKLSKQTNGNREMEGKWIETCAFSFSHPFPHLSLPHYLTLRVDAIDAIEMPFPHKNEYTRFLLPPRFTSSSSFFHFNTYFTFTFS